MQTMSPRGSETLLRSQADYRPHSDYFGRQIAYDSAVAVRDNTVIFVRSLTDVATKSGSDADNSGSD
jgi:hypothetical protein